MQYQSECLEALKSAAKVSKPFEKVFNPKFNSRINPKFNSLLNFHINTQINPAINTQINPKINTSINPRFVASFLYPAIFNMNHEWVGFAIKFDCNNVDGYIVFNLDLTVQMRCFFNSLDGYNLFDTNNEWIGTWVKTDVGFFEYLIDSKTTRYIVL